jgi:hypothetical protein
LRGGVGCVFGIFEGNLFKINKIKRKILAEHVGAKYGLPEMVSPYRYCAPGRGYFLQGQWKGRAMHRCFPKNLFKNLFLEASIAKSWCGPQRRSLREKSGRLEKHPSGAKARNFIDVFGTAEAVPFQNIEFLERF